MGRFLILLLLGILVAWWLFGRAARLRQGRDSGAKAERKAEGAQEMVSCAHCGIHLPRAEALTDDGRSYCSDGHRRLGPRAQ